MARQKRPKIVLIDQPEEQPVEKEEVLSESKQEPAAKDDRKRRKPVKTLTLPEEKTRKRRRAKKIPAQVEQVDEVAENPPRQSRGWVMGSIVFGVIAFVVLGAFILIPLDERQAGDSGAASQPENCLGIFPNPEWNLELHELECSEAYWEEGKQLSDWLLDQGVSYKNIISLQDQINRQKLKMVGPGQVYTILHSGNLREPNVFAYQSGPREFTLLQLKGEPVAYRHTLELTDKEQMRKTVTIEESLADAMYNREFGLKLTQQLESALKWDVDFFHLSPGDQFLLLYDIDEYEGHRRNLGRLSAVRYTMHGEVHHAFYFANDYIQGYFDDDGHPMKANFLKAPLDYVRISSPYNLKRSDPFTGKTKAHLGTDYAAPAGTEIVAVSDGIVTHAEFKGNNGNYVKILHSKEIQTQYLHMQSFAKGIKPGVRVSQGQVIGYVGMTGRATGPHVCFRFWKNGEQVDHRRERGLGSQPPLKGMILEEFMAHRDSLWNLLEPI